MFTLTCHLAKRYPCFRPGERKPFQVILIFTDCSESKSIAEALHQAKEKAEEADGLKSAFLAIMSHEIRTPLNSVLGYIDLALANGLKESNREENIEGLRIAKQSGKLLYSVINDILDISRIEAGQLTVAREPFSLRKVVDQSLNLGKAMVIQRKVSIEFESEIGGSVADVIYGDFWRLQQVLSNLISNAVKVSYNARSFLLWFLPSFDGRRAYPTIIFYNAESLLIQVTLSC